MEQQKQGAEEPKQQTIKKRSTAEHQKNQLRCWMEGRGWAEAEAESIHRAGRARSKKQKAKSKKWRRSRSSKINQGAKAPKDQEKIHSRVSGKSNGVLGGKEEDLSRQKQKASTQQTEQEQEARKGGTAGAAKSIKEAAGRSKGSKQQENRRIRRNNR
jgi:hypothetical protein